MKKIGIREAKIHLSRLIEDVSKGKEIIITNHNRPVAKLCPITESALTLEERITIMERQGLISPAGLKEHRPLPPPLPLPDQAAQKYLQEDRES